MTIAAEAKAARDRVYSTDFDSYPDVRDAVCELADVVRDIALILDNERASPDLPPPVKEPEPWRYFLVGNAKTYGLNSLQRARCGSNTEEYISPASGFDVQAGLGGLDSLTGPDATAFGWRELTEKEATEWIGRAVLGLPEESEETGMWWINGCVLHKFNDTLGVVVHWDIDRKVWTPCDTKLNHHRPMGTPATRSDILAKLGEGPLR